MPLRFWRPRLLIEDLGKEVGFSLASDCQVPARFYKSWYAFMGGDALLLHQIPPSLRVQSVGRLSAVVVFPSCFGPFRRLRHSFAGSYVQGLVSWSWAPLISFPRTVLLFRSYTTTIPKLRLVFWARCVGSVMNALLL